MPIRRKPLKEDLIYAASALDCEGNVSISKRFNKDVPSYSVKIGIANTIAILTDFLLECFGGHVHTEMPKKLSKRIIYRWQLHGENASNFLKDVLPSMKLKTRQAETAVFFHTNRKRLSLEQQEKLHQYVKALNRGEVPAETKREDVEEILRSDSPIPVETLECAMAHSSDFLTWQN